MAQTDQASWAAYAAHIVASSFRLRNQHKKTRSLRILVLLSLGSLVAPATAWCSSTLWGNATPASISTDPNAYELGVNFYADQSGFITAIRFYKGSGNTGTHIGHLWDNHGNLLS
ncbi:MAG TPA: DUF4082 domain-containing protein, partial [Terriglobia bacterium]|nr:DUF4082 domain-containing protein [Terriglobia bacterium]